MTNLTMKETKAMLAFTKEENLPRKPKWFHQDRIHEVAAYTNRLTKDIATFADAFVDGDHSIMKKAWTEANPQNTEDRGKFYDSTDAYVYNLMFWREILLGDYPTVVAQATSVSDKPLMVLDFGAGNGDLGILFSKLGHNYTYMDMGKTKEFAEWRFSQRGLYTIGSVPSDVSLSMLQTMAEKGCKYDVVICLQVLEALENPIHAARWLAQMVKSGGKLILKYHFGADPDAPFHLHTSNKRAVGKEVLLSIRGQGFTDVPTGRFDPARVFTRLL